MLPNWFDAAADPDPDDCTGWRALHALANAYGDSVSQSAIGTSYLFDASAPPSAE